MIDGLFTICLSAPEDEAPARSASSTRHRSSAAAQSAEVVHDDFISGAENRLALAAVESVLAGGSSYSPLVLCGPPGVGKSHLARGIAQSWKSQHPHDLVLVMDSADFARALAAAVEDDTVGVLRSRYHAARLIVIEDLTHITSRRAAHQELIGLLDVAQDHGSQIILTTKLAPSEIPTLPPALVSRLSAGLEVPLSLPGPEARLAILRQQAARRKIAINPAAARLIAESISGTVPELVGALQELHLTVVTEAGDHAADASASEITVEQVRSLLLRRSGHHCPNLRSITGTTARYFGLKVADLTSPSRRRAVVMARGVAMYLARELTGKSLEQVGAHFGGRDHTTVLHSYRNTERRLRTDPETRRAVTDLRKMLAHG